MTTTTMTARGEGASTTDSGRRDGRLARAWASFAAHPRVVLVTALVVGAVVLAPTAMSPVARLTLAIFVVTLALTAFTKADEVKVCSAALAALVLAGGSSVGDAVDALTSHTVILLVGAFVVAAAAKRSGIAERLAFAVGGRARTVGQLMTRITWVLIATAFLVPSTSGRAALMLPVYLAFAERIDSRRVRRALAVLFPAVILLSAVASLFGAGAHLVMTELVVGVGADRIGFLEWTVYGLPFAIVSSFVALATVRWLFLRRDERRLPVELARTPTPWTRNERTVAVVLGLLTVCWLTEPLHGVPAWAAAVVGAAAVTIGPWRATTIGAARQALPLDLLFVMAVTAEAGSALARTGAADWIAVRLLGSLVDRGGSPLLVVLVVGLVSLLAHLVVTSRTARASVLLPVVILVGSAAGLDVSALAYLSTAAAGYCLTTTTSAKPIRVFSTVEDGFGAVDLRRLSLRLLPLHVLLLVGFSFYVWPMLGLALGTSSVASTGREGVPGGRATELPWAGIRIDGLGVGPRLADSPTVTDPRGDAPVPSGDAGDGGTDAPAGSTPTPPPVVPSTPSSSSPSVGPTSSAPARPSPADGNDGRGDGDADEDGVDRDAEPIAGDDVAADTDDPVVAVATTDTGRGSEAGASAATTDPDASGDDDAGEGDD